MSRLLPGDPLPWTHVRTPATPAFPLSTLAGRVAVLTYLGSAAVPRAAEVIAGFRARADLYDGRRAVHLLVSCDPGDERERRIAEQLPGFHVGWDFDQKLARTLGAFDREEGQARLRAASWVFDPLLRVQGLHFITDPGAHAAEVSATVEAVLPPAPGPVLGGGFAPALLLPRVLEPALCTALLAYLEAGEALPSGVMVNRADGQSTLVVDSQRKRRRDRLIHDPALLAACEDRIRRRVLPEARKAFQVELTRIERYVLARYDAEDASFFGPHRDNGGRATAHRRFACSFNLNAEDYEGGDLSFPEFGPQRYRAPTGGCVVFSCSLLHEVDPMRRGRRYCLLPFLFDEAGETLRLANLAAAETR